MSALPTCSPFIENHADRMIFGDYCNGLLPIMDTTIYQVRISRGEQVDLNPLEWSWLLEIEYRGTGMVASMLVDRFH